MRASNNSLILEARAFVIEDRLLLIWLQPLVGLQLAGLLFHVLI